MTKEIKVLLIAAAAVLIAACVLFVTFSALLPSAQSVDTGNTLILKCEDSLFARLFKR